MQSSLLMVLSSSPGLRSFVTLFLVLLNYGKCAAPFSPPFLKARGTSSRYPQTHNKGNSNDEGIVEKYRPVISFPGAGIYYWWQAGAVNCLNQHYDLTDCDIVGASAGALSATLLANSVDVHESLDLALSLVEQNGVWERGSLGGVWGGMVRTWLDTLLPADAHERSSGRVHLLELQLRAPFPKRILVSDYESREDLIDACMASVHIPYFMDMHFSARFRGKRFIDGSFLARRKICSLGPNRPTVFIAVGDDPMMRKKWRNFLKLHTKGALQSMMQHGYNHVLSMMESGELHALESRMRKAKVLEETCVNEDSVLMRAPLSTAILEE